MVDKLSIAVCDDEKAVVGIIANSVASVFRTGNQDVEVEAFSDASALARRMETVRFNLVFLDIDMPETDGIEFARAIRDKKSETEIIFVSNREDRVFEAFRLHPFGFVRKSNFLNDISAVIDSYLHTFRPAENQRMLSVQTHGSLITVSLDEVIYIESYGKKQMMRVKEKQEPICFYATMEKLERELTDKGFLRVHKGYIVNYLYIRVIDNTELTLTTDEKIPVSRSKLQETRTRYVALLQGDDTSIF